MMDHMVEVTVRGALPSGTGKALLARLAGIAYRLAGGRGSAAMSVSLVGDAAIRRLNRVYRGKDRVTDVLSFANEAPAVPGEPRDLGDVFIDGAQVRRQAKEVGRTVREELCLMVVHGTLHLMGHDHKTLADERRMFGLQHEVLLRARVF